MKKIFYLCFFATLLNSCTREDSLSLSETKAPLAQVTYMNSVKSIMDNNCVSCHAAVPRFGAPMSLVTYNDVKESVLNRGLVNRMQLPESNAQLMPQGGPKLPENITNSVIKWQTEGFIE